MKKLPVAALTLFLCLALPAFAGLCEKCQDRSYTKDIGECAVCRGMTTSGEFQLCFACSDKLGQCEHCRAVLAKPAEAKPTPAGAIDVERNGIYRADGWVCEIRITSEGTRSQGVVGVLSYKGAVVPEPAHVNDYQMTPWGKLYWVGNPLLAWRPHGWMPKPLAGEPAGVELAKP